MLSFRKNRNDRNKNAILDAKMFKILTMTPKTFPLLKAELPFDKNGIQSTEWLFAMCSKSRSGAKSVRLMKMIVRHLSNGRYKILAPRTRLYCAMRFDENFNVFLHSILIRKLIESSWSVIQIRYAGRRCYIRTSIVSTRSR